MDNASTLLGLLSVAPSYGYDLKHTYDRYFGLKKPLAFGQVYSTLSRMVRDGLLAETGTEAGGGPERRRYEVTSDGRERLAHWMFTPDVPSESLQSNLFAKTVLALLTDRDAGYLLDLQRAQHMQQMRALTQAKQQADLLHVLLYDHALFHIEADLRWMDLTAARLDAMKADLK
jgi:DNA-binding PadR family transcriptional regulator